MIVMMIQSDDEHKPIVPNVPIRLVGQQIPPLNLPQQLPPQIPHQLHPPIPAQPGKPANVIPTIPAQPGSFLFFAERAQVHADNSTSDDDLQPVKHGIGREVGTLKSRCAYCVEVLLTTAISMRTLQTLSNVSADVGELLMN
ncbi:10083_t:CDS:2 [Gigaspora rosea]|nr:10083_t:CDS:2 [Gigaspora rosea]